MNQSDKFDDVLAECCMCGDTGIPDELHRCKVCRFRYQHRYCSNQYPKDWACQVCNWCLASQMEDLGNSTQKAVTSVQNSSDSNSSQCKTAESDQDDGSHTRRLRKSLSWKPGLHGLEAFGKGNGNGKVKKAAGEESTEVSPTMTLRKRIITRGALEEKLRRTKSEEMANGRGVSRQVFRNKVRRYKLLEEVSR